MSKKLNVNGLKVYEMGDPKADLTAVFLHGYGAAGRDLMPLASAISWPTPVRFLFPEGPFQLEQFFFDAHAWFPFALERLKEMFEAGEGKGLVEKSIEADRSVDLLLGALEELKIDFSKTVIAGFSQGGMMALEATLRTSKPFLGTALFSVTPIDLNSIKERALFKPGTQFFQSHGYADSLLPFAPAKVLFDALVQAGWQGTFCPFQGNHEIEPTTLEKFEEFVHALFR